MHSKFMTVFILSRKIKKERKGQKDKNRKGEKEKEIKNGRNRLIERG